MRGEVLYREVQRDKPWWVWAVVAALAVGAWGVLVAVVVLGLPRGGPPPMPPEAAWLIAGLAGGLVPVLTWVLRQETVVSELEVRTRLYPFPWVRVRVDRIREARARRYRPMLEYGGWGWRLGLSGWCVTLRGTGGVQLVLANGRRLLIGSERAEELEGVVRSVVEEAGE